MSTSTLTVEQVRGRSVVVGSSAQSPLQLLNPSNEGSGAWVYLASLGGGFVGDDALSLDVEVRDGAMLFLSSQASTKAYRGSKSSFTMKARVGADATFILWPQPVTCFAGAALEQVQRVDVAETSSVLLVDAFTAGRVAREERWAFDSLSSRLSVDVEGTAWLREGVRLDTAHGELGERMHGLEAFATIVMRGPRFSALAREVMLATSVAPQQVLVTVSPRDDGAVVRVAAPTVEGLLSRLQGMLRDPVSSVLGDSMR
jgi:urease accessory protein